MSVIDVASLQLVDGPVARKGNGSSQCATADLDADGLFDLKCHFDVTAMALTPELKVAELVGNTTTATPIRGSDAIIVR